MGSCLPIGIDELLGGAVEGARLEFKASWDPDRMGHPVVRSLCAFANDLQNLNGGYVLIGVAERNGVAVRPVAGLDEASLDAAQKWIRGHCNRIDPVYMPVMDVAEIDGRRVLVLWAPASDTRPHQAPEDDARGGRREYWIRVGSETIRAQGELLTALMRQTARVPFDDRRNLSARNEDISFSLTREFLEQVRSELLSEPDAERVYRHMRIVSRVNGHTAPRNVALMFFANSPEEWFPGARIEVAEFPDDAAGDVLGEKVFRGPLHHQIRNCLTYLEGLTTRHLEKGSGMEASGWSSYPMPALREAVVNAVYHRDYDGVPEPIKIHVYPNRIEIVSYPGPVQGIEARHLRGEEPVPPFPARNRRIGEFLKELRLAESRGTGLPRIRRALAENGSEPPSFDFDEARSYFRVTLPAHPEHAVRTVLRDYAYKKATGDSRRARDLLERAWARGTRSSPLAAALVQERAEAADSKGAEALLKEFAWTDRAAEARAWFELGRARRSSGAGSREAIEAFERACELAPDEARYRAELERANDGGAR